jgi:hypothetical protein
MCNWGIQVHTCTYVTVFGLIGSERGSQVRGEEKEGRNIIEPGAVCATPCLCPLVTPVKLSVVPLHDNLF